MNSRKVNDKIDKVKDNLRKCKKEEKKTLKKQSNLVATLRQNKNLSLKR